MAATCDTPPVRVVARRSRRLPSTIAVDLPVDVVRTSNGEVTIELVARASHPAYPNVVVTATATATAPPLG